MHIGHLAFAAGGLIWFLQFKLRSSQYALSRSIFSLSVRVWRLVF